MICGRLLNSYSIKWEKGTSCSLLSQRFRATSQESSPHDSLTNPVTAELEITHCHFSPDGSLCGSRAVWPGSFGSRLSEGGGNLHPKS